MKKILLKKFLSFVLLTVMMVSLFTVNNLSKERNININPPSASATWSDQSANSAEYFFVGTGIPTPGGSLVGSPTPTSISNALSASDSRFVQLYENADNVWMGIRFYDYANFYSGKNLPISVSEVRVYWTIVGAGYFGSACEIHQVQLSVKTNLGSTSQIEIISGYLTADQPYSGSTIFPAILTSVNLGEYIKEIRIDGHTTNGFNDGDYLKVDYIKLEYTYSTPVPSEPNSQTLTSLSDGRIRLNWAEPTTGAPLTGYKIYRSESSGALGSLVTTVASTTTTYTDAGLTKGTTYYYTIRATNNNGESTNTAQLSGLARTVSNEPALLDLVNDPDLQINLTWTAPSDNGGTPITKYHIFRSETSFSNYECIGWVSGSTLNYSNQFLSEDIGKTFYYRVLAENIAGNSSLSNIKSTGVYSAPGQPTLNTVTAKERENSLDWVESAYDGGSTLVYILWWGYTSDNLNNSIVGITQHPYNHTGLSINTYFYKIQALNLVGWSANSSILTATPYGSPGKVSSLTQTSGNKFICVNWTAPIFDGDASVTGYSVYRKIGTGAEQKIADHIPQLGFNDTGLSIYANYTYRVIAINSYGEGDPEYVIGVPYTEPNKITPIATTTGNRSIHLSWSEPPTGGYPVLSYKIYYKSEAMGSYQLLSTQAALEINHTGLTLDVQYSYRISSVNMLGEGVLSDEISLFPNYFPNLIRNFSIVNEADRIVISWEAPIEDIDGITSPISYKLFRGLSSNSLSYHNVSATAGFVDYNLEDGKIYYYAIKAVNIVGDGNLSITARGQKLGLIEVVPSRTSEGINLDWLDVSDAVEYRIFRGSNDLINTRFVSPIGITKESKYSDNNLDVRGTYFYIVHAYNSDGQLIGVSEVKSELYLASTNPFSELFSDLPPWALYAGGGGILVIIVGILIKKKKENSYMSF